MIGIVGLFIAGCEMNIKLKETLIKIGFVERFKQLFQEHNHSNLFKNADIDEVIAMIKENGYLCSYNKKHKFYKVQEKSENVFNTSLHISLELGVAEFILNIVIDGQGDGGPFSFMCDLLGSVDRINNPRFSNYKELNDVLSIGFSIYEDIKKELGASLSTPSSA